MSILSFTDGEGEEEDDVEESYIIEAAIDEPHGLSTTEACPRSVTSRYDIKKRRASEKKAKRQAVVLTTVLAGLCYVKNTQSNMLQTHIGYFLYGSNNPKQVIEVLHQVGLSVCYKTVLRCFESVAISCETG